MVCVVVKAWRMATNGEIFLHTLVGDLTLRAPAEMLSKCFEGDSRIDVFGEIKVPPLFLQKCVNGFVP